MQVFGLPYHHHEKPMDGASPAVVELYHMLAHIINTQEKIMAAIDDLATAVAAEDTVIDSAVVLLQGIPALIAAAGTNPAKLTQLQSDITAKTTALSAAVLSGTPIQAPATSTPISPSDATAAATASVAAAAPGPTPNTVTTSQF
jgi:hypothetical protein